MGRLVSIRRDIIVREWIVEKGALIKKAIRAH